MKNLVILLLVGIFMFSFFSVKELQAAEKTKIGYIDVATAFDSYDKTKDEDAQLGQKSEGKQKQRDRIIEKIRNMKSEIELLSDAQKEKKQAQIDEEIGKLQDFDRESKTELRRERDNMVRNILKEIDTVINDYAQKNDYTLILNSRVLVYAKDQDDITREIINLLNSKYRRKQ